MLLDSVLRWWHRSRPRGKPQGLVIAPPARRSSVPVEYQPLYTYLANRYGTTAVLTFVDVEALLGFPLPAAARSEREWWTRPAGPTARHAHAWTAAGRTAHPNLLARTVAFERER
jgi:hypothetical protein